MNRSNEAHHIVVIGDGADSFVLAARLGHKLGRNGKARVTFVDQSMSTGWSQFLYEVEGSVINQSTGNAVAPCRKRCTLFNSDLGVSTL
jgi:NADH:ubiquinone reductase (H+-translocating)